MLRDDWKFEYPASRLAAAATEKIAYHRERLAFWRATREQVMATIRSEGLEIDEKIVLGMRNPKSRDWDRGAEVMIRNDLQKDLAECLEKLKWHTDKLEQYGGWEQLLVANPEARQALDIDDWLFFFARPGAQAHSE